MAGFPSEKKGNRLAAKAKKPRAGIPFDKDVVAKLIPKHFGNISRVADTLGSCRGSIRQFINRHPDLQEILIQARERQLDELEDSCFTRAINTNDTTLQLFLLKTQGKSRGYEQSEAINSAKDIATAAFDFIISKQDKS